MPSVHYKSTELFKKFIQTCFWQLFLPHSSSDTITFSNYIQETQTYFPDYIKLNQTYKTLLKEIPYRVRLERPELVNRYLSALTTLVDLIEHKQHNIPLSPIFELARTLYGENMSDPNEGNWSILLQVLCAYSSRFEGEVPLQFPLGFNADEEKLIGRDNTTKVYSTVTGPVLGKQRVSKKDGSSRIPPFWKWYMDLIYPSINNVTNVEEQEHKLFLIFNRLSFPFMPGHSDAYRLILPLPNVIKMQSMLRSVSPSKGDKGDNAIRLYSAIQFVTFGIPDVDVIGNQDFIPTDIVNFNEYLRTIVSKEASVVSKYSISDFNRSQVSGALEEFRLAELENIKQNIVPEEEHDDGLDDDSHDPNDDINLDPDIDKVNGIKIGNEANDLDDSNRGDNDDEEQSETTDGDNINDNDGGNTLSNDEGEPDGSNNLNPDMSGDIGSNDKQEDEVSSKNTTSRKAYKAIWGRNPIKLANDNDIEGFLYRSQLCRLNKRLKMDPGDAISKEVKSALNEWCKFWAHTTDVRCSITLVKKLGLAKYLKV